MDCELAGIWADYRDIQYFLYKSDDESKRQDFSRRKKETGS